MKMHEVLFPEDHQHGHHDVTGGQQDFFCTPVWPLFHCFVHQYGDSDFIMKTTREIYQGPGRLK